MKTLSSWERTLASAAPRDHLVQLYTRDEALVATVGASSRTDCRRVTV